MTPRLIQLSLIALLAATPALAQDDTGDAAAEDAPATETTTGETPTQDAPADEAPAEPAQDGDAATNGNNAVGDALDTGESVSDAVSPTPSDERTFVKAEEEDWKIECIRLEDGSEGPCQLYQLLKAGDDNPVAEARLFKVDGGGQVVAGANFIVPLETLLTQKLTISVDGGQAKRYDFAFCTQIGCIARVGFTAADLNQFKRGVSAKVSIVPALAPDQRVTTTMSLAGFTAGYDQLTPIPAP